VLAAADAAAGAAQGRTLEFLDLALALLAIVPDPLDLSPVVRLYAALARADAPFTPHLARCARALADPRARFAYAEIVIPFEREQSDGLAQFVPGFLAAVRRVQQPPEFVQLFLDRIVFARFPELEECAAEIVVFLRTLLASGRREELVAAVDRRFGVYARDNLPMLLVFCKEAKIKRDVMKPFAEQFQDLERSPHIDADGLVAKLLDSLSMRKVDRNFFEQLLRRKAISERVQQRILAIVGHTD
jgi:hypothetical protein